MEQKTPKLLIVDDEADIRELLRFNLESSNYTVIEAESAEQAMQLDLTAVDLILLDVMMGTMSGLELAKALRQKEETADIPIIFISAKTSEDDLLKGFLMGGDDYIAKPFSLKEVLARVKAVLKRNNKKVATPSESYITLLQDKKMVLIDGKKMELTKREFNTLELFMQHEGRVLSRDEILDKAWPSDAYVTTRTIDVIINRLRKKLSPYGDCIASRSGYGYIYEEA